MSESPTRGKRFQVYTYTDQSDLNGVIQANRNERIVLAEAEQRQKAEQELIDKILKEMDGGRKVAKKLESYVAELERNKALKPSERAIQIFYDNDKVINQTIQEL